MRRLAAGDPRPPRALRDEAAMVAPGHGEPAGREALATTLRLTAAAAP